MQNNLNSCNKYTYENTYSSSLFLHLFFKFFLKHNKLICFNLQTKTDLKKTQDEHEAELHLHRWIQMVTPANFFEQSNFIFHFLFVRFEVFVRRSSGPEWIYEFLFTDLRTHMKQCSHFQISAFFLKCFMNENREFRSTNVYISKFDLKQFRDELNRKFTLVLSEKNCAETKKKNFGILRFLLFSASISFL